jgi:hypothetical protein
MLFILLPVTGCDNFVEVEVPGSQLTGNVVFEDRNTANAAMVSIYSKLRDSGLLTGNATGTSVSMGLYADELEYYGTNDENISFLFNASLLSTTNVVSQLWNDSYHQIYCSNAVIEGCTNSNALSTID